MAELKTAAARSSAAAEGAVREAQLAEMVFKRAKADEERLRRSSDLAKEREEKKRRKKKAADDAEAAFGTFMDTMAQVVPQPGASYGDAASTALVHGAEDGEEGDGSVISGSHAASTVTVHQQLAQGQTAQRLSKRGPPNGITATPWPGRYLQGVLAKDSNKIRNLLHNEVAEILFVLNPVRWNDETLYGKPCSVSGVRPRSLAHRDLLLRALFRECPDVKPDDPIDPSERWNPHLLFSKITRKPIEARQPPIGGGTGSRDPPMMSVAQESTLCVSGDAAAAATVVAVRAVHQGIRLKLTLPVTSTLDDLKTELIESFGWTVTPGRVQVGYLDNGEEYTLVSDRTVQSLLATLAAHPRSADAVTLVPTNSGETKRERKRRLKEQNLPGSSTAVDFTPPVAAPGDTQAAKKRQRTTKKEEPKEEEPPAAVKEESPQVRHRKKKGRAAKKEEQLEQQQEADQGLRAQPVSALPLTDVEPGVQASPKKTLTKKKRKLQRNKSAAAMDGEDIAPDCSASSESALGKRAQREELDRREKLTTEERNAEAAQAARVEGAIQRRSAKKSMAAPPKSLVQDNAAENPSLQAMRAKIEAEVRARLQQELREEAEAAKKKEQQAEAEAVEAKEKKAEEHEKKKEAVTGDEKEAEAAKKQQAEAEAAEAKKKKTEENEKKKEAVTGDEEEAEDDNNDEADAWWEGGEEERDDAVRSEPEEGDDAAVVKKRPAAAATDEELGR
eukprot:TRINITY_DN7970_c0_g1_i2.p1 TRINITY_DN7970_c0_g1~~TRINITY_DN7970_c0_g1_i2.p1  ORF type:complete len:731 (-),score=250.78 TRINITY_DN7970_c0_g1_i2:122-2314(-)